MDPALIGGVSLIPLGALATGSSGGGVGEDAPGMTKFPELTPMGCLPRDICGTLRVDHEDPCPEPSAAGFNVMDSGSSIGNPFGRDFGVLYRLC